MIYLLTLLMLFFGVLMFESRPNTKAATHFYWFQCISLVFLSGLRNYVGGDSIGYMAMWDDLPQLNELHNFEFSTFTYQPLWYFFNALVKEIYNSFFVFQIFHAAFVNLSIFLFIKKFSKHPFTSVLVYFLFTFFYFNTEILRESLAISVFLFAAPALAEKRWKKYFLLVTIAFMFHSSAIILFFLPLLSWIFTEKFSLKTFLKIFLFLSVLLNPIVLGFIIDRFFPSFKPLVDNYSNWEWSAIGLTIAIIKTFMIYLIILVRQQNNVCNKKIDIGLRLYFFFAFFSIIAPIGQRFMNYFVLFFIISLVELMWQTRGISLFRKTLIFGFFLSFTMQYYFRDTTASANQKSRFFHRYYPYYSVFEEIPFKDKNLRTAIYRQEGLK